MKLITTPTRRAMLGALAVAASMPAVAVTTANAKPADTISPELARLFAEHDAAMEACRQFDEEVYGPTCKQWRAAIEEAEASVPHVSADIGENHKGERIVWTTEGNRAWTGDHAKNMAATPKEQRGDHPVTLEYYRNADAFARKVVEREELIAAKKARAEQQFGMDALWEESQRLDGLLCEACNAIDEYQPKTLADFHAKLKFMVETDAIGNDAGPGIILADMSRLLGLEA